MAIDTETGVHKVIRETVGPWLKEQGFKRTKQTALGWYKAIDKGYLTLAFHLNRNWNGMLGGAFSVMFKITDDVVRKPHFPSARSQDLNAKITSFLSGDQLEEMRLVQNQIIADLAANLSPDYYYYEEFNTPDAEPYQPGEVLLLRFRTENDLVGWLQHLVNLFPEIFKKFEAQWNQERPDAERVPVKIKAKDYTPWEAIIEAPDDDSPRLIYADWLEEQGDLRAEFIRLQCQAATIDEVDQSCLLRSQQLENENYRVWTNEIENLPVSNPIFRRGFIEEVTMTANQFVKKLDVVLDQLPLLTCVRVKAVSRILPTQADPEALQRLKGIAINKPRISWDDIDVWKKFFLSSCWESLQHLDCSMWDPSWSQMGPDYFQFPWQQITHLNFSECQMSHKLATFLQSLADNQLRSLSLAGNGFSSVHAALLAGSEAFTQLEELDLSHNSIGNKGVRAIAESPNFPNLKILRISNNRLTKNMVKCLLETKHFPALVRIQVRRRELAGEAFAELSTRFAVAEW